MTAAKKTTAKKTAAKKTTARAAEAADEGVSFEYDGVAYTVPPQSDWPVSVAFAIEEGRNFAAAKAILGDAQWAKFEANHTLGDLEGFFEALGDAIGGNPTS